MSSNRVGLFDMSKSYGPPTFSPLARLTQVAPHHLPARPFELIINWMALNTLTSNMWDVSFELNRRR